MQHTPRAGPAPRTRQTRPGGLNFEDMGADEMRPELTRRLADRPHEILPVRDDIADALDPVISGHPCQDMPIALDPSPGRHICVFHGNLQHFDMHTSNVHSDLLRDRGRMASLRLAQGCVSSSLPRTSYRCHHYYTPSIVAHGRRNLESRADMADLPYNILTSRLVGRCIRWLT